jgi:VanZ family protein
MLRIISLFGNKKLVYAATFAYAAFIFIMSNQSALPGAPPVVAFEGLDKLQHFILYGVFGMLVFCSCWHLYARGGQGKTKSSEILPAWLFALTFAALDEVHQSLIPGRNASYGDVIADGLGIVAAYLIWLYRLRPLLFPKNGFISSPSISRRSE